MKSPPLLCKWLKIDSIVFRGNKQSFDANKRTIEENDLLLSIFSKKTSSKTLCVNNSVSLLGAVRTCSISPVTIYRGDFEVSSKMKIKVSVLKMVLVVMFIFESYIL